MIALLQRVSSARVEVAGERIGEIGMGLLALVCAERRDEHGDCDALVSKVLRLRIFDDGQGRMNRALAEVSGGLLVVPQFTLAADTRSGTRPSFTPAAEPVLGRALFERFVARAVALHGAVATGAFGAHMQVSLVNDGPVTIWLRVAPSGAQTQTGEGEHDA